jgi:NADPH:quinone reductase-like Zn-dependent oxidoreductase
MLAMIAEEAGGPHVLSRADIGKPTPPRGEVLVRLHASGVNYADVMLRAGRYPGLPGPQRVLGCEGSGVVEAVGPDVTRFKAGDRVGVYSPRGGSYAEWMIAPENYALPLPPSMPFEDAAAMLHVFLTADHALRVLGRGRAGEWVVITAAAGGVGTALIQLAHASGLRIIGGVGSPDKLATLRDLGVEHRINYRMESLSAFVRGVTAGYGADLVLESVGGAVFQEGVASLAPLGRLIVFGVASGERQAVDPFALHRTSSMLGMLNMSTVFANRHDLVDASWSELVALYEKGAVRPFISRRFRLEEVAEAHRLLESRATVGKLVLTIRDERA